MVNDSHTVYAAAMTTAHQFAPANGIQVCYESLGSEQSPTILLIMGLGMQLVAWPDEFCQALVDQGFRVIRFDNRDVGHSSKIHWSQKANLPLAMLGTLFGVRAKAPYLLDDMAKDAIGLLDYLQIPQAHIVGVSMGGMIAQTVAAHYPQRVLSLTSIMSSSGNRKVSRGKLSVLGKLIKRPPKENDLEAQIKHLMHLFGVIGSPGFATDQAGLRQHLELGLRRSSYSLGMAHQLLAILASGDRRRQLAKITAPTLVIHGEADPLVPVAAGRDTAQHIKGAQLHVIPGMGHDLPPGVQALLLPLISEFCHAHGGTMTSASGETQAATQNAVQSST